MSIADKITQLTTIRGDIRTALAGKGVSASDHDYADFAADIAAIPSGGGGGGMNWESLFTLTYNNVEQEIEFVLLSNFDRQLKTQTGISGLLVSSTDGVYRAFMQGSNASNPFYNGAISNATASGNSYILPKAVSDASIDFSTHKYTSVSLVGTTKVTNVMNAGGTAATSTGWTSTITVTASSTNTIRHFIFIRQLRTYDGADREAIMYAIKMKNPVELNAENNYTAQFTLDFYINYAS